MGDRIWLSLAPAEQAPLTGSTFRHVESTVTNSDRLRRFGIAAPLSLPRNGPSGERSFADIPVVSCVNAKTARRDAVAVRHACGELRQPFISHDISVVRALAHEILVIKDRKIVEAGPTDRVMAAPEHPYTRALMAAAFDLAAIPA